MAFLFFFPDAEWYEHGKQVNVKSCFEWLIKIFFSIIIKHKKLKRS